MFTNIQIKNAFSNLGILKVKLIDKDLLNKENTYRIYLKGYKKISSKDIEEIAAKKNLNYAGCDFYERMSYFDLILYY